MFMVLKCLKLMMSTKWQMYKRGFKLKKKKHNFYKNIWNFQRAVMSMDLFDKQAKLEIITAIYHLLITHPKTLILKFNF